MSTSTYIPYKVKDISLAEWGRKEIRLAEAEMPGLMALRAEFGPSQPLLATSFLPKTMLLQPSLLRVSRCMLGRDKLPRNLTGASSKRYFSAKASSHST